MQNLRQRRAMPPVRLMYAPSGHDADMLYATRFYADDPFVWWELIGKSHIALSPLEIDRAKPVAKAQVHALGEFSKKNSSAAAVMTLLSFVISLVSESANAGALG